MISISRRLVRQLRSVFKHALGRATRGDTGPLVYFQAGPDGLNIRVAGPEVSIEFHEPGQQEPVSLAIPFSLLAECEGRGAEPVHLELSSDGAVRVEWQDKAIPQSRLVTPRTLAPESFPITPAELTANEPEILVALREASATADQESTRYALGCISLKGNAGRIAATDGRQLLVQSGYEFSWNEDVLISASSVFGCRELALNQPVRIGRSETYVSLAIGPWKIHLKINAGGRFPKIEDCVPDSTAAIGRLIVDPGDAEFLGDAIRRLPDSDDVHHPVTLDLNGEVIVRATAADQPRPTELVLVNSGFSGQPTQICTDRRFLARAANLKLGELCVFGPDKSVLARDARRQMVFMPLAGSMAAQAGVDPVRIESPAAGTTQTNPIAVPRVSAEPARIAAPCDPPQKTQQVQRQRRRHSANKTAPSTPVEQAVAVKLALRESLTKVNELVRSLRRQKRLSRLARTTLASLKELQKVA